ncbi:MAG: hypothetical protein WBQ17_15620 [Rhizomicrobium sp.]
MRDAAELTNIELVARLYDSAEKLRAHGHSSILADWCEEAAARLRERERHIEPRQRCA